MWEDKGKEAPGGSGAQLRRLSSGGQLLNPGEISVIYQFAHG